MALDSMICPKVLKILASQFVDVPDNFKVRKHLPE